LADRNGRFDFFIKNTIPRSARAVILESRRRSSRAKPVRIVNGREPTLLCSAK
jgi:hypothetical protein